MVAKRIVPRGGLVTLALETKPTYRYCVSAFVAVATPTDVLVIQGSATKRVRVVRLKIDGAATAAGNMPVSLVRRSSQGTLGSAVLAAIPAVKHDSNQPAATAVVSTVGTANYTTPGTLVGLVECGRIQMSALGTGLGVTPYEAKFVDRFDKPFFLRGVNELLCVNLSGAAIPAGGVLDITVELEEDDDVPM